MNQFYSFVLFIVISHTTFAQYQIGLIPRVSPDRGVYQKIGNTEVEIKYGSPHVNNREIWGDLVSYDDVWRAGANNATTISFSNDVTFNNKKLTAGTYSFFIIPRKQDKWTVIFNNTAKQWGAFEYDSIQDALRIDVVAMNNPTIHNNLEYTIDQNGYQNGRISLRWEHVLLHIDFNTDYTNQFIEEIKARAATADSAIKWVVYLQGSEHLAQLNTNLDLALNWANTSESLAKHVTQWNDQFYPKEYVLGHLYWTKAKLYAELGDYKKATEYSQQMLNLGNKPLYYTRKNKKEKIDKKLSIWKTKSP